MSGNTVDTGHSGGKSERKRRIPGGGIPTMYRGTLFRSRTEARWAAFFDELTWAWEYEPHDLVWYIPDFALKLQEGTLLCEVKGCNSLDELREHTSKIDESGWRGEALLVGSGPLEIRGPHPIVGLIGEPIGPRHWLEWSAARLFFCLSCGHTSVCSEDNSWRCRVCGAIEGHMGAAEGVESAWAKATNRVQWRPST